MTRLPTWSAGACSIAIVGSFASAQSVLVASGWSFETNQANAQLSCVRAAGDVDGDGFGDVLAAAPLFDTAQVDAGSVWLFRGSNTGLASTPTTSSAGPDQANASFGAQIAAAGDVDGDGYDDVLVSAPGYSNPELGEGAVFLYRGAPSGLSSSAAWTFEGNSAGASVNSVAGAGDLNHDGYADVLIGVVDPAGAGRIHIFYGRASGPTAAPNWTLDGSTLGVQPGGQFGSAVSSAGDVDADGFDDFLVAAAQVPGGGRAWLFRGAATLPSTTPTWSYTTGEAGADLASFGGLGAAGDVNGDGYADVVVAASGVGFDDHGAVYVFLGSQAGLAPTPSNVLNGAQSFARFGQGASAAGDVNGDGFADLWIGARFASGSGGTTGRTFLHLGSGGGISTAATHEFDGALYGAGAVQSEFGASVAPAGDVDGDGFADTLVAAPRFDSGEVDEGRAGLFTGRARGLITTPNWLFARDLSENLGHAASTAGDVNGDGFDDIIAGAPGGNYYASTFAGKAYVFLGGPGLPATTPNWTLGENQLADRFGTSVANAGDVNGDGFGDVIVGAPAHDRGQVDEGAVFLYLGGPLGLSTTPALVLEADQAGAFFGQSVANAGDVNGDGLTDVIVGAPFFDGVVVDEGRVFVFLGDVTNPLSTLAWTQVGNASTRYLGMSVSGAGDVNGDGKSDVIVTNWAKTGTSSVFVFHGPLIGTSVAADWTQVGPSYPAVTCSTAGDVNGDGFSDVVGAYPPKVWLGSSTGLSTSAVWTLPSPQGGLDRGIVGSAGDLNGDGYSDVAVGDPYYDSIAGLGRAWVFLGSAAGPSTTAHWSVVGYPSGFSYDVLFGSAIGSAGDVNGDGIGDLIVGAESQYFGDPALSRVFLYLGNVGGGPAYAPKARRSDDAGTLEPLSRSGSPDAFRLRAKAAARQANSSTIRGRAKAFLEYEVKPLGSPFDGTGLQRGPSIDTGAPNSSTVFDVLADGLQPGTAYRWRARVASDDPVFAHSRWLHASVRCRTEAMVRTSHDCNTNAQADEDDIASLASADQNIDGIPDECQTSSASFCSGDGSATACPCGNVGASGNGCGNSVNSAGAHLSATGFASVSVDTLVLQGSGMTPTSSVLYFQGTAIVNSASGSVFGDGLRCAGGFVIRLGIGTNQGGASSYPGVAGDPPISVKGQIPIAGGVTRHYQAWFRDAANFCSTSVFNLTNGVTVTWAP